MPTCIHLYNPQAHGCMLRSILLINCHYSHSVCIHIAICESEITTIPPLEQEGSNITLQWPQANLGEEVTVPCSCGGLTIGSISLVATRRCGGDFTLGARWETPMQVTCNFSPVSQDICQVARLIVG